MAERGGAKPATIVLAAGRGSRFGGVKQLAEVDGIPILRRVLDALEGYGDPQLVVLGAAAPSVERVVPASWRALVAADWSSGRGASLRAGLAAVPEASAALVCVGDLPWLRREAVEQVLARSRCEAEEAVRPFEGKTPGHPLLLRGALLGRARDAPDKGLGRLLGSGPVAAVDCGGLGVCHDVDTVEDLSRQPGRG